MTRLFVFIMMLPLNALFANNDSLKTRATKLVYEGNEFLSKNQYDKAINIFEQSIDVWNNIDGYDEFRAYPYFCLGSLYREIGDYSNSLENYNNAEKVLLNASKDRRFLLGALYSRIGLFYQYLGDYNRSYFYYNEALRIIDQTNVQYSDALYGKLESLFYLKKYNECVQQIEKKENNTPVNINKSKFYSLKSNCLINIGRPNDAIPILESVIAESKQDSGKILSSCLLLSKAYIETRDVENANLALSRVNPIIERQPENNPWVIFYWELSGRYYRLKGEQAPTSQIKLSFLSKAIDSFDKALKLNSMDENDKIPYLDTPKGNFISPSQVSDLLQYRADVLKLMYQISWGGGQNSQSINYLEGSLHSYLALINFLHDFRISLMDEDSRMAVNENQSKTYIEAFNICYTLWGLTQNEIYKEQMLFLSESSKASCLLASINSADAKNFGGLPDSLVEKEQNLRNQIASYNLLLFNEKNKPSPDTSLIEQWNNKLFGFQKSHDDLMYLFEKNYSEYYKLKYKSNEISSRVIRDKITKNQVLIEYFIDEPTSSGSLGSLFIFLISKSGFEVKKLPISSDFTNKVEELRNALSPQNVLATSLNDYQHFVETSYFLYSKLISPFASQLSGKDVIVVPDNKLAYIPFDALIATKPTTTSIDFKSLDYLVKSFEFSYTYSATLLYERMAPIRKKRLNILAFAPYYSEEVDNVQTSEGTATCNLSPLNGAISEVEYLKKYSHCTACLGYDASESNFKRMSKSSSILHLAMHTEVKDSLPLYSKMVFTLNADSIEDGFLHTQEIYNMSFRAKMAVLSACNTGNGEFKKGEGIIGLSRAFFYAGCPSVIMTLWPVEDMASSQIMKDFYKNLFHGESKTKALRKAKLNYLKNADPLHSHPYYWMGYIVIGDPSHIVSHTFLYFSILLSVFTTFIVFIIWYLLSKKG